jgi:hypothetical protein
MIKFNLTLINKLVLFVKFFLQKLFFVCNFGISSSVTLIRFI